MKLGYIGSGLMGRPRNRSRDKLASVVAKGARSAASPAEVARAAEIVMMCVTDQHAAEEVLFGPDGIASTPKPGLLVVDFSSIAPASARDLASRLEKRGVGFIDAPVSGGVPAPRKARSRSWRAARPSTSSACGRS